MEAHDLLAARVVPAERIVAAHRRYCGGWVLLVADGAMEAIVEGT